MGTSSMIANYNEDGTVTATYCHYDGYLAYNGRLLFDSYNTPEKAKAVANVGYLSGLKSDLYESVVEAVHTEPTVEYASPEVFLRSGDNHAGADYLYLFDGEAWFFTNTHAPYWRRKFEEVELNLKEMA
jgi:hypothetical protein